MQIVLRECIWAALKANDFVSASKDLSCVSVVLDKHQPLLTWYTPAAQIGANTPEEALARALEIKKSLKQAPFVRRVVVHSFGGMSIEIKREAVIGRLRQHYTALIRPIEMRWPMSFHENLAPQQKAWMKLYFRTMGILHTVEEHGMIKDTKIGLRALSSLASPADLCLMMHLEEALEGLQHDFIVDNQFDKKLAIDVQNYYNNVALWAKPDEHKQARWCLLEMLAWVLSRKVGWI